MPFAVRLEPIRYKARPLAPMFERVIPRVIDAQAREVKRMLEKCVETWAHKVEFVIFQERRPQGIVTAVGTNDLIFKFVDRGTKPHPIDPRPERGPNARLIFYTGGAPKTYPGVLGSGSGRQGTTLAVARHVNHPGTEARWFTKAVDKFWRSAFAPQIQEAIRNAIYDAQTG